jgi:hypothetical protein
MRPKLTSTFFQFAALSIISLFFVGCSADSPLGIRFNPPKCVIVNIEKRDKAPGQFAKIVMTVQNTGDRATACNIGCEIRLKRGNLVIETRTAGFGTLKPGEAAIGEAWFTRIEKHTEYNFAEYTLFWYDAQDGYYED